MAKGSTFPADDVPDRRALILGVLKEHDPVPVPMTRLYLSIEDKRALADEFERLRAAGEMEPCTVQEGEAHYEAALGLADVSNEVRVPLVAYRLTAAGRAKA